MITLSPPPSVNQPFPPVQIVAIVTPVVVSLPAQMVRYLRLRPSGTGGGVPMQSSFEATASLPNSSDAIREVKRISGLTWKQIANLFGVTPRAVHLWADGGRLDTDNADRLYRVLDVLRSIDMQVASLNRSTLMSVVREGSTALDLLHQSEYTKVRDILGFGKSRARQPSKPLSSVESAKRETFDPAILMTASQDSEGVEPYRATKIRMKSTRKA